MGGGLTLKIIRAVADERDVEPSALRFALNDHIDPEAIEQLVDHERGSWVLSFELPDCIVTVASDGTVSVDDDETGLDTVAHRGA